MYYYSSRELQYQVNFLSIRTIFAEIFIWVSLFWVCLTSLLELLRPLCVSEQTFLDAYTFYKASPGAISKGIQNYPWLTM
jgi:hypothetical protein